MILCDLDPVSIPLPDCHRFRRHRTDDARDPYRADDGRPPTRDLLPHHCARRVSCRRRPSRPHPSHIGCGCSASRCSRRGRRPCRACSRHQPGGRGSCSRCDGRDGPARDPRVSRCRIRAGATTGAHALARQARVLGSQGRWRASRSCGPRRQRDAGSCSARCYFNLLPQHSG